MQISEQTLPELRAEYEKAKEEKLSINMARGIPSKEQLDLAEPLLRAVSDNAQAIDAAGTDTRNYGVPTGIAELKRIFLPFLGAEESEVLVGGASSLNLIYDLIADGMLRGFPESERPWKDEAEIQFLCPVPGYDRHFSILEALGIRMIPIALSETGVDCDEVERLVQDPSVKGMIFVPKYANPDGCVYSDEVLDRLARMKTAAGDFKFFCDNAYGVHDLYGYRQSASLFKLAKRYGTQERVYTFMSTSKITYAGGGVSFVACAPAQMAQIRDRMSYEVICYDKVNQLRHARFLQSPEALLAYMERHAQILRPKFELVDQILTKELADCGFARWSRPRGGYFVSLDLAPNTARKVFLMMRDLGITLTSPGATFPYHRDPEDRNLRISPTAMSLSDLKRAITLLALCAKIAYLELQ